jgi:single-strand DNA-binding protein
MSINTATISGRLGSAPELKSTNSGKTVAKFSIAVDDGWGDKKKSSWFTVEAWDRLAEAAAKFGAKGLRLAVTGRLAFDEWEKNGEKVSRVKIVANQIEVIDYPQKAEDNQEASNDDIPF